MRLWVDNELLIDQWKEQAPTTYSAQKYLGSGHHLIRVDYYENTGGAVAKVSWRQVTQPVGGWRGEYYNNKSLSGYPAVVRDDPEINFFWGYGSPAPGINTDNFSVRWSRTLDFPARNYRFTMTVDDGARLFVNGHLLIDAWRDQSPTTYSGDIYLPGGPVTLQMEYYENTGGAVAQLSWGPPGPPPPPPPPTPPPSNAIIVDDSGPGFVKGGLARGWRMAPLGHGGQMTWTRNNAWRWANYNWGRWYPNLTPGWYEVFVFIPSQYANTTNARYWVATSGGYTLRVVNQARYSDQWVSLGRYWFQGTGKEYISLADITYEPYLSRYLAFDAVKWEPR